jgi:L-serine dehydratase
MEAEEMSLKNCRQPFILISSTKPIKAAAIIKIKKHASVTHVSVLKPVLPIISRRDVKVPFLSCAEMLRFNKDRNLQLWELAVAYEMARGNISAAEVFEKMAVLVRIMTDSIDTGLRGTEFADRILPAQSPLFKKKMARGKLLDDPLLNRIILYVSALMEMKSSMGIIVAAPTAGACGTLPGAIIGAGRVMAATEGEIVKAMLAAGLIGVFIAAQATFAAEDAGCQAECGSASGMAAAGLVHLVGGNLQQALIAASLALQNSFGMTCDPIANRVEAPCLGKNVMAAANALACANMALAGYQQLIPLDEVLQAFDKVGRSLPRELRCTALGGLSMTKTAQKIQDSLLPK